jgi:hypothetical protein
VSQRTYQYLKGSVFQCGEAQGSNYQTNDHSAPIHSIQLVHALHKSLQSNSVSFGAVVPTDECERNKGVARFAHRIAFLRIVEMLRSGAETKGVVG